ncbi:MAG: FHA domain-containing protein [Pseudomonadales bacterium]|jgi:hypothetical protein
MKSIFATAVLAALVSAPTIAQSALEVLSNKRGDTIAEGLAIPVTQQIVVTRRSLLDNGDSFAVIDPTSGARLQADVLAADSETGFTILSVNGANFEPLTFSAGELRAGERVALLTADEQRSGFVLAQLEGGVFQHDLSYSLAEVGSMVLNRCGELAGWNIDQFSGVFASELSGSETPVNAKGLGALTALLQTNNVKISIASEACPTLEEEADAARQAAQAELERIEAELAEQQAELEVQRQAAEEAAAQAEAEREQSEAAAAAAREAEAELAAREAELEAQRTEAEAAQAAAEAEQAVELEAAAAALEEEQQARQAAMERAEQEASRKQQLTLMGAVAGVIGLIVLLLVVIRSRKRQTALDEAKARFNDVLLSGHDGGGNPYRVRIDGGALRQAENGMVIGKNASQAQVVIANPQVSRAHARIWVEDNGLKLTDLGSSNGTQVNDIPLQVGQVVALRAGDKLALGGVFLNVELLD